MIAIPPASSAPEHVADQEVAALELLLVFVDDPADVKALLDPLLVLLGEIREDLADHFEGGPAAQLANDVPIDLGHDHGRADRPAPLADDRSDRERPAQLDRHRTVGDDCPIEDKPVLIRHLAATGHATEDRRSRHGLARAA